MSCVRIAGLTVQLPPPGVPLVAPGPQAQALLDSGCFKPSTGWPPWVSHYRCSLSDGTCLHLVIDGDAATLHRDRFDPHQGAVSLLKHLVSDAPVETALTVGSVALAALFLRGR